MYEQFMVEQVGSYHIITVRKGDHKLEFTVSNSGGFDLSYMSREPGFGSTWTNELLAIGQITEDGLKEGE